MDLANPDIFANGFPHDHFRRLRAEEPVHWHTSPSDPVLAGDSAPDSGADPDSPPSLDPGPEPGFWVLTRYEDIKTVTRQPSLFVSSRGTMLGTPSEGMLRLRILTRMDPPDHAPFRKLVSAEFTPRSVEALRAQATRHVEAALDEVVEKGEFDFATAVAEELPLRVVGDLLGIPEEDLPKVVAWSHRMAGAQKDAASQQYATLASIALTDYLFKLGCARRAEPRDDLTSRLVAARIDGRAVHQSEWSTYLAVIANAANETTRHAISQGLWLLLERPELWDRLRRDPSLVPCAVEEMLRFRPPARFFRRTAARDTRLGGRRIREGERVTLWFPSANRDEAIFERPDDFDPTRAPNPHLAFGAGHHMCLGAHLARLQMQVVFAGLLRRFERIELAGPVRRQCTSLMDGVAALPVRALPAC